MSVLNAATSRLCRGILAVLALVVLASASAQLSITYDRSPVATMVWFSVAAGDLTRRWVIAPVTGADTPEVFRGEFYWVFIGDVPSRSFVAYLKGTHDHVTDDIVFDGFIVDGYMLGARVEDRGTMVDYAAKNVAGTIQIFPAHGGAVPTVPLADAAASQDCRGACP